MNAQLWQYALFAAFSLSGFSGLIYESVWTNYLKFFLGHAAYAQTLVLALFMGGMATGAWLAGRYLPRIKNPLIAYVLVEIVIGLFGLLFHKIFIATSSYMLNDVLPGIESLWLVELIRWVFAAILIVPQTILLGATFPLISIGILRAFPATPGSSLSMLYFTNSIGAVAGVLVSGFVLVAMVGLPGTILTAALINFLLALIVYSIDKKLPKSNSAPVAPPPSTTATTSAAATPMLRPLLMIALITGLSSFIYEVSWIRMLTMVLGASTHSFELMLSAFILGLALGGLWLRKRIDRYRNPLAALGVIQLLMGLLALVTVLAYNSSFDVMAFILSSLQRNETGYVLFNLSSHLIASALMLPVTFMAGMTLPLLTLVLFKQGGGESAVGRIYAFNTFGAIIGVTLAAMLLLPMLGLKTAVMIGAALDLLLAVYLFMKARVSLRMQFLGLLLVLGSLTGVAMAPPFDTVHMSGGVFRHGQLFANNSTKILMHRDGKTATVDVYSRKDDSISITTNGKTDASIRVNPNKPPTPDEDTMAMLGGLPIFAHPKAETAAVIGMGAGVSADVLLMNPNLKQLDVIEIEAAMVEGARLFGKASARVFQDPRSQIHIDDAKSYFASHKKRYDVIVSEPSDTWVSGVSSLFTDEFYQRIALHLNRDGILVQWLHIYETSPQLVSSIFLSLGKNFEDYRVYASNGGNLVILAKVKGQVPALDARGLENPLLRQTFARLGWDSMIDVVHHEIGDRRLLEPLFLTAGVPLNSDFFPYVDQHAVKARFLANNYIELANLRNVGIPFPGNNFEAYLQTKKYQTDINFALRINAQLGRQMGQFLANGGEGNLPNLPFGLANTLAILKTKPACNDPVAQSLWQEKLLIVANTTIPHVTPAEAKLILDFLRSQLCSSTESAGNIALLQLMDALGKRDMPATELAANKILNQGKLDGQALSNYALNAIFLAYYKQEKWQEVKLLSQRINNKPSLFANLVIAHATLKAQR